LHSTGRAARLRAWCRAAGCRRCRPPALVEQLPEHLHTGAGGLLGGGDADDLDFFADLDDAALDTAGDDGAAAADAEDVFDGHQEGAVDGALGGGDVAVQRIGERHDRALAHLALVALQRQLGTALHDRRVVARELVLVEQLATSISTSSSSSASSTMSHLFMIDDDVRTPHLARQQDVLARLRHRAVGSSHHRIAPSICAAPVIMFFT
jgi:hypothetical protein